MLEKGRENELREYKKTFPTKDGYILTLRLIGRDANTLHWLITEEKAQTPTAHQDETAGGQDKH